MKLEDLKEFNMPHYKYDRNEMVVGSPVAEAMISTTADAWVWGYSWKEDDKRYHQNFQVGISQHEDSRYPGSRDQPKEFPIFVIGIVEDGIAYLAYATSRNPASKKVHTLRITPLKHITGIGDYRLIPQKDKSHSVGL